jgi:hypothetical protein
MQPRTSTAQNNGSLGVVGISSLGATMANARRIMPLIAPSRLRAFLGCPRIGPGTESTRTPGVLRAISPFSLAILQSWSRISSAMATRKPKPRAAAIDPGELLKQTRAQLIEHRTIKLTTLGSATQRAAMVEELVKEGFEATKSVLRIPVAKQLVKALGDGSFISLKSIASFVVGASAAEAKKCALALVASGSAQLVQRGSVEVLVPSSAGVVSRAELARFAELAKRWAKIAGSKNGTTLLRQDFDEALAEFTANKAPAIAHPSGRTVRGEEPETVRAPGQTGENVSQLLAALEAAREPSTGLAFVPRIMERLGPRLNADEAQRALLDAATAGLIELRPEGGLHRLSEAELLACPPGPQGTRLSWARRLDGTQQNAGVVP